MPQIIEVPGHGQVEFPDGMTDDQIVAAIKANSPQQPKPNQAALNPEAKVGPFTISGEGPNGFNPAAALIKAGQSLDNLNKGVIQASRAPGDWLRQKLGGAPDPLLQALEKEHAENKRPMKDLAAVHPGSALIGDVAPLVGMPWRALPAVAAAEYGSPKERAIRTGAAVVGNKLGEMAGKALARVPQPIRPAELSETQRAANAAAERIGVNLSAGEATGSRALKFAESTTADLPLASGMAQKRYAANAQAMNQAAARSIGQDAKELTPAVLAQARADTSAIYKSVLQNAKVNLDNTFRAEVQAVRGSKVMKELRDESVDAMLDQFRNMPQGKITVTGEWFQQNKTALDEAIRSAYNNSQPGKAKALEGFERALDRAAQRSLTTAERADYKKATRQWANLRMLETGKVVESGNAMPGRLDQALGSRYGAAYKEGRIKGELPDIASLANSLRPPPNSGTLPRSFYAGSIGGAAFMEPMTAAGMLVGPSAVQAVTTSPLLRKYLTEGLLDVSPQTEALLMRAGGYGGMMGGMLASP